MIKKIIQDVEINMKKVEENFIKEINSLRLGRASISLLEGILVEYYGSKLPINQVATISIPNPQTLVIQPWDKTTTEKIVKAIQTSNLGLNPVSDSATIKIPVPPLSEERRKELVKVLRKLEEQAKVEIREIRRKMKEELKKLEKEKKISEDDSFRTSEELQKITDKFMEEIEKITSAKEKEILES
ncbi:MAG: ribosome recycling factor [Candidatus Omnitrophica bacterium]|nr:ribosome recycling factor [Candidatus Omnitrophota bacterium]MCM8827687.1 ribosome recycling factor [Candidatus Omnitrophota bacterium]